MNTQQRTPLADIGAILKGFRQGLRLKPGRVAKSVGCKEHVVQGVEKGQVASKIDIEKLIKFYEPRDSIRRGALDKLLAEAFPSSKHSSDVSKMN